MKITPSIKLKEVNLSGKCNIKIRIAHNGRTRFIGTRFYISPEEWNISQVKDSHPLAGMINMDLRQTCLNYEKKLMAMNVQDYTVVRIVELLTAKTEINDFTAHYRRFWKQKEAINAGTGELYYRTLNKIQAFDSRTPLTFEDISVGWLKRFEASMRGMKKNARAIHLRNIRSVINNAIDENIIGIDLYPFRRFKIEHEETRKRAVTLEQFRAIRDYETKYPVMALARDMWLLSFYTIGTNLADIWDWKSITGNGRIIYKRKKTFAKTGKPHSIKIEPEARAIIEKHKGKERLLNLSEQYEVVHDATAAINHAMKRMKIADDLEYYSARHSWATFAKKYLETPIENISEAFMHTKKTVTEIYTDRDPKVIDALNKELISFVNSEFTTAEQWKDFKAQKKPPVVKA